MSQQGWGPPPGPPNPYGPQGQGYGPPPQQQGQGYGPPPQQGYPQQPYYGPPPPQTVVMVQQFAAPPTVIVRPSFNHGLHAIITICTCGLWLPVWILLALLH